MNAELSSVEEAAAARLHDARFIRWSPPLNEMASFAVNPAQPKH